MNRVLRQDFDRIISDPGIDWQCLKDASFFVTGATGLVGSLLVKTLLEAGKALGGTLKVYALARNEEKARSVLGKYADSDALQLVIGDVRQEIELHEPVDYVIHTASVTTSKYMVSNPVDTLMTAVLGTENVLQLAKKHGVKGAVYLSSMEVYGQTKSEENPVTEEKLGYVDVLKARSSYPEGKRACECLCAAYAMQYGLPVKIARLAQTFGAGVSRSEGRVFAQFAKSCLNGEDIVLHTTGRSMGNYCYTADVISALLILLCKGENGKAYNVVNENTAMQICQMAQLVSDTLTNGQTKIVFDIPEDALTYGYAPDVTMRLSGAAMRELGWNAKTDLPEMFIRMCESWREEEEAGKE